MEDQKNGDQFLGEKKRTLKCIMSSDGTRFSTNHEVTPRDEDGSVRNKERREEVGGRVMSQRSGAGRDKKDGAGGDSVTLLG